MTTTIKPALLAGLALALFATAARAADYGVFERPSTGSQVHFYDCGGKLCGKVVAVKDAARKAEIGKFVMHGAAKAGANSWKGDLTDVGSGKVYSGTATLAGASLEVKGCVAAVLCQTENWSKVK